MNTIRLSIATLAVLCATATTSVFAEDRPADKIIADIKAVEMPKVPTNRSDRAAVQEYSLKAQKAIDQKSALIAELYKSHPDCPELPALIFQRWQLALMPGPKAAEIKAEVDEALAKSKNEKLVAEAAFVHAIGEFRTAGQGADPEKLMAISEGFIKKAPKDDRGAMFLSAVSQMTSDAAKQSELNKRIEKDYPNSREARQFAAERRVKEAVGKPFNIEFTDAIKGTKISSETLKGKVLVIDFWATWCGPCVREMPNMKKLYAEYKDKGVEFIGVSLDKPKEEGGLDSLKDFVAQNKIEWPQYYQGNFWQSEFSSSWGINSIPCVFLVDADGKLVTTEAGGQLEELIPAQLAKAEKAKTKKAEAKP